MENPCNQLDTLGLKSAVDLAKSWQGQGAYSGVDDWIQHSFRKGDLVAGGTPGRGNFYSSPETFHAAMFDKNLVGKVLQVKAHPTLGYRQDVTLYRVTKQFNGATSKALQNPQFGPGGGTQYFVPDKYLNFLEPVQTLPLKTFSPTPLGESNVFPHF